MINRFRQSSLHARIRAHAVELGYDPAKIKPIYDGVVNWASYLSASLKVCWILKEPYDDTDENGNPAGGGWTMFKDFAREKRLAEAVNANPALRNVAYASHAILNGVGSYSQLPWLTDDPDDYEKTLFRIAYCNVGKMPAKSVTPDSHLADIYRDWKEILFAQIDLCAPDVVIVCGTATLQCMNQDIGLDLSKPARTVTRGSSVVDVHAWHGRRLVWAPHPAARIPPQDWVDSVVEAVRA